MSLRVNYWSVLHSIKLTRCFDQGIIEIDEDSSGMCRITYSEGSKAGMSWGVGLEPFAYYEGREGYIVFACKYVVAG